MSGSYRIVAFCAAASPTATAGLLSMLDLLYRSARTQDAGVTMTLLTDMATALSGLPPNIAVSRHQVAAGDLMLARTRAQSQFVARYDFAEPLAFLDLDILVNRPIASLFDRDFDIALTTRRKHEMPINGGVIFAGRRRPANVRSFFADLLDVYETKYRAEAKWWGDQQTLNNLVPVDRHQINRDMTMQRDGRTYLLLPGTTYNFPPHMLWATIGHRRRTKYILHFKSADRKKYMKRFFDRHFGSSSLSTDG